MQKMKRGDLFKINQANESLTQPMGVKQKPRLELTKINKMEI